jgi:LCP family protein required for cell wall assembly
LIGGGDSGVAGAEDDRINLLLLGVGGAGHDGPELSDTILLSSFRPSTGEVGMISIPRDLLVNIPGYGLRKVNHVNAYAENENTGSGPAKTADFIGQLFEEDIQYAVKVDFRGFAEIIDAVGGVDIYIERSFSDPTYPIDGMEDALCGVTSVPADSLTLSTGETEVESAPGYNCRYESLTFNEGWTHMDGATALKYARSRHGNNGEGSDFARAARQQKILLAVKEKLLSSGTLLNPRRLSELAGIVRARVSTTIPLSDMISLAQYLDDVSSDNIRLHVISNGNGLVYDTNNGTYGLLPYKKDWSDFRALAQNIFAPDPLANNLTQQSSLKTAPVSGLQLRIENGTNTPGLAARASELLESAGYTIVSVGNAAERPLPNTLLLDGSAGKRQADLTHIANFFKASIVTSGGGYLASSGLATTIEDASSLPTDVDAVLILGEDSLSLLSL